MKKIIAIVAVIATITAILCICANAYETGEVIEKGTIIVFKDNVSLNSNDTANIKYICDGQKYKSILMEGGTVTTIRYKSNTSNPYVYVSNENGWVDSKYKTIEVTEDYTIPTIGIATNFNAMIKSTEKPIIKQTLNNTKATFTTTLTVATVIIAWLMANQLALVGLYMYILIALIATGKRFITGV